MKDSKETTQTKKHYTPPVLTEYGEVCKLTQGGTNSVNSDHGNDHMYN